MSKEFRKRARQLVLPLRLIVFGVLAVIVWSQKPFGQPIADAAVTAMGNPPAQDSTNPVPSPQAIDTTSEVIADPAFAGWYDLPVLLNLSSSSDSSSPRVPASFTASIVHAKSDSR